MYEWYSLGSDHNRPSRLSLNLLIKYMNAKYILYLVVFIVLCVNCCVFIKVIRLCKQLLDPLSENWTTLPVSVVLCQCTKSIACDIEMP